MKQKTWLILILFSLFLIPTLVNARTSCDDYCERGIYYSDGSYNTRTEECDYAIERCESGCNVRGAECAVTEIIQEYETKTCDPYCEDGVYYGRGAYNRETEECEYQYRNKCEGGCNRIGTECYQSEAIEIFCPDYCSDDTYYYGGSYDKEAKRCRYVGREVCRYGCDLRQDNCAEPGQVIEYVESIEKTCRDSDDGRDFEEKGKVLWVYGNEKGTLNDHCVGSTLVEYYCDNDVRAVAYKECSENEMLCKDAKCIKLVEGYCIDPDGNDLTTKAWADGTNAWNTGLVSWGDYCSETPDGGSTETGDYIHEAICLETDDNYYEVRYAGVKKCEDGCVDGICVGSGELVDFETENDLAECDDDCGCVTREQGVRRFGENVRMCNDEVCGYTDNGTPKYCIGYEKKEDQEKIKQETEECDENSVCMGQDEAKEIVTSEADVSSRTPCGYDEENKEKYCVKKEIVKKHKLKASSVKAVEELKSEITDDGELIIIKGDKKFNLGNVENLLTKYVRNDEEIKEVSVGIEEDKPIYNIRKTRKAKLFGFIPIDMKVTSKIDAEKRELIEEKRPWWSFMAIETSVDSPCVPPACMDLKDHEITIKKSDKTFVIRKTSKDLPCIPPSCTELSNTGIIAEKQDILENFLCAPPDCIDLENNENINLQKQNGRIMIQKVGEDSACLPPHCISLEEELEKLFGEEISESNPQPSPSPISESNPQPSPSPISESNPQPSP